MNPLFLCHATDAQCSLKADGQQELDAELDRLEQLKRADWVLHGLLSCHLLIVYIHADCSCMRNEYI
jgi:hypothetical protein